MVMQAKREPLPCSPCRSRPAMRTRKGEIEEGRHDETHHALTHVKIGPQEKIDHLDGGSIN